MISFIISLFLVLPMILGMMGYDIFNRRPASRPMPDMGLTLAAVIRQGLFYFMMIFILLTISTAESGKLSLRNKILATLAVTLVFFFLFTLVRPSPPSHQSLENTTEMMDTPFQRERPVFPDRPEEVPGRESFLSMAFDIRRMTELIFIFITTTLIGKVYELVNLKQQMQLENEQLRAENLQSRYDVLLSQVNPHFFFNSLNSLSSLIRDGRNDNALKYVGELSNTFRYAMQSSTKELVTVAEEIDSVSAYCYLLQIRYEDKLFFEINVSDEAKEMLLPVLTLQPLIENVVKHNVISSEEPLMVTITGNISCITVINPVQPRQDGTEKSGIGLRNLTTRYKLLTGSDIIIEKGGDIFSVTLPLKKPEEA